MKEILINASSKYNVNVGTDILKNLKSQIQKINITPCKIMIITDDIVNKLYSNVVEKSFKNIGFQVFKFVFRAGEASKNLVTCQDALDFLSEKQFSKNDIIVALGGGVVGDLAGFVAASYLRGVRFINIPTTLLAVVDASIGGKTGVNLTYGKNLVGAFWQPILVIADCNTLSTLSTFELSNGIAEIIKYAAIYDSNFYDFISKNSIVQNFERIIINCIKIKSHFVKLDEFDRYERQKLNFGHTLGHAIENCSNYKISHGQAVAIGMACIAKASSELGFCKKETYLNLTDLLKRYNLPTMSDFTASELYDAILCDKKRTSDIINFVLIDKVGNSFLHPLSIEKGEVLKFVEMAVS